MAIFMGGYPLPKSSVINILAVGIKRHTVMHMADQAKFRVRLSDGNWFSCIVQGEDDHAWLKSVIQDIRHNKDIPCPKCGLVQVKPGFVCNSCSDIIG